MNPLPQPTYRILEYKVYCLVRKNHTLIHVQGLLNLVHTTYPTLYEQSDYILLPSWLPYIFPSSRVYFYTTSVLARLFPIFLPFIPSPYAKVITMVALKHKTKTHVGREGNGVRSVAVIAVEKVGTEV